MPCQSEALSKERLVQTYCDAKPGRIAFSVNLICNNENLIVCIKKHKAFFFHLQSNFGVQIAMQCNSYSLKTTYKAKCKMTALNLVYLDNAILSFQQNIDHYF